MRVTRAIAIVGVYSFLSVACASGGTVQAARYVVKAQDTLYSIAWRHDLDYRDLARWNHIGADYKLLVGQTLVLQGPKRAGSVRTPPPAGATRSTPAVAGSPPTASPTSSIPDGKWVWPTERLSPPRPVPGGGILLFGVLGQDVRAASAGKVVYTGNGIRGYGNLVILKHADGTLSSYALNRDVIVHEGQDVAQGETIAHMGVGPHSVSTLFFEIRVNGKPVAPEPYLPKATTAQ